jgi:hypothetical protein
MKTFTKLAIAFALSAAAAFCQTGFTTTTLTNAISYRGQNVGYGGTSSLTVGSTSGMTAPALNTDYGSIGSPTAPNISFILIDQELMRVNSVPSTTVVVVERGVQGTKAAGHNAGATVYVAIAAQLYNSAPTGSCTASTLAYLPVYSFTTGQFFNCLTTGPTANLWSVSGTQAPYTWSDASFFVGPENCVGVTTGTAGTGNNTMILDGSVPALKISATSAGASVNTFSCTIQVPTTRSSVVTGITVQSINAQYSVQTTTATSQTLSTLATFTSPAPAASETASSATLVAAGGTITQVPVVGSANLTAVSAGSYYTSQAKLGTPFTFNTPNQTLVFTFSISQSASAAQIVTLAGLWVNAYATSD